MFVFLSDMCINASTEYGRMLTLAPEAKMIGAGKSRTSARFDRPGATYLGAWQ